MQLTLRRARCSWILRRQAKGNGEGCVTSSPPAAAARSPPLVPPPQPSRRKRGAAAAAEPTTEAELDALPTLAFHPAKYLTDVVSGRKSVDLRLASTPIATELLARGATFVVGAAAPRD